MGSDPAGSFKTHANYLRSLAYLIDPGSAWDGIDWNDLHRRIIDTGGMSGSPDRTGVDLDQVRRSLSSAWGTEFLIHIGEVVVRDDELVALSNNWSVVQAYYATYHAAQALTVAKKFPRPDSHSKTQNQFFSLWGNRRLQLTPWTLAATEAAYINLPTGRAIDDRLHPWTGCDRDTCWDLACKALRTTREDAITDALARRREAKRRARRQEWSREERERLERGRRARRSGPPDSTPQLTTQEKAEVRDSVRPMTMIDYLYRLRLKTNYVDSDMFTDGPELPSDSLQVRNDVRIIAAGSLFAHEVAIGHTIGFDCLVPWATEWANRNLPPGAVLGIGERLPVLRTLPLR